MGSQLIDSKMNLNGMISILRLEDVRKILKKREIDLVYIIILINVMDHV